MIAHFFRTAARWVFFAGLAYAPWAYGATTPVTIQITNWILLIALVLWGIELLISRRAPDCSWFVFVLSAALICVGGWMVLNAKSIYDAEFFVFVPLRSFVPFAPGSVEYAVSAAWMIRAALLLGAMMFVADLSQSNRWLLRLWYVIALVGGSVAFLGLLQKATGAQMIFWQPPPPPELWVTTFFATYYYHGNAGGFLNLVWPLTAGLVIRAFANRSQPVLGAIWVCVLLVTISAVVANTSRMAQIVALVLLIAICTQFRRLLLRTLPGAGKSVAFVGVLAIILALIALAQAIHLDQPLNRWQEQSGHVFTDARWQAFRVATTLLPDAGLLGFGPGTFRVVFPSYTLQSTIHTLGTWRFLHEDYLQTLLEWGWLGCLLWALLFFGGIMVAIRSFNKQARRAWTPRRRVVLPLAIIALSGVALHALVDFPLQIQSLQLYVATYLGMCWGSTFWNDRIVNHESAGIRRQKSRLEQKPR